MANEEVMRHNRTVLASLKEGDLVEFPRPGYSHWAVYVGNDNVIHRAGGANGLKGLSTSRHLTGFSGESDKGIVRMDNIFHVAGTYKIWRNNNLDNNQKPLYPEQIVKNAHSRLNEGGYNVIFKNCEHFATWCRYGEASSDQVKVFAKEGIETAAGFMSSCFNPQ